MNINDKFVLRYQNRYIDLATPYTSPSHPFRILGFPAGAGASDTRALPPGSGHQIT